MGPHRQYPQGMPPTPISMDAGLCGGHRGVPSSLALVKSKKCLCTTGLEVWVAGNMRYPECFCCSRQQSSWCSHCFQPLQASAELRLPKPSFHLSVHVSTLPSVRPSFHLSVHPSSHSLCDSHMNRGKDSSYPLSLGLWVSAKWEAGRPPPIHSCWCLHFPVHTCLVIEFFALSALLVLLSVLSCLHQPQETPAPLPLPS